MSSPCLSLNHHLDSLDSPPRSVRHLLLQYFPMYLQWILSLQLSPRTWLLSLRLWPVSSVLFLIKLERKSANIFFIKKQQKFYSLPERYDKIRQFVICCLHWPHIEVCYQHFRRWIMWTRQLHIARSPGSFMFSKNAWIPLASAFDRRRPPGVFGGDGSFFFSPDNCSLLVFLLLVCLPSFSLSWFTDVVDFSALIVFVDSFPILETSFLSSDLSLRAMLPRLISWIGREINLKRRYSLLRDRLPLFTNTLYPFVQLVE